MLLIFLLKINRLMHCTMVSAVILGKNAGFKAVKVFSMHPFDCALIDRLSVKLSYALSRFL